MPYAKAAKTLEELLRVVVSKSTARRETETAGAAYVEIQTEEAEQIEKEGKPEAEGMEQVMLSVDGAIVPLVKGE